MWVCKIKHHDWSTGLEGQSGTQLQSLENQEQQFSVETTLSNDNERFPELGASSDIPGIENAMEEEISNESDVGDLSPSLAAFIAQVNHGLRGAELTLALHHWDTETDSSFSRDGAGGRVVYDWGLMSDSGSSSGSDNESEGEGNEILDDLEGVNVDTVIDSGRFFSENVLVYRETFIWWDAYIISKIYLLVQSDPFCCN